MGARILVIEANGPNLDLMTYLLNAGGHTTIAARDGAHGFERIKDGGVDLVICGLELPTIDGYEIAQRVRSLRKAGVAPVPLIAVTGPAATPDRETIQAAGFDGLVTRPISLDGFVAQVEAFVEAALRSLPHQVAESGATAARTGLRRPGSQGRLLIADHSRTDLTLMANLLEPFGYHVMTATTAAEALARLAEQAPDVIVVGLEAAAGMADDLLTALRGDPALERRPVLILASPDASDTERERARERGARKVLRRPIDAVALLDAIEALLERR